ncbi:uncharacterized protein AB675_11197 [Cyphellophora attinorum]|uniref:Uncharacterized protein n=1 Tax=Cyphellophora attinorum TaxID=1664694 RepID=A0A0N0NHH2_9EURO|nr:uncharacterized protein AB675_11197 [Phialophora attinorum]KPI34558.1 hypothetical protein AB675_11197 [Phialophora attinorum]
MTRLAPYIVYIASLILTTTISSVHAEDWGPGGFRYPPIPTQYVGHPTNTSIKAVWSEKGKKYLTTSDRASRCAAVTDGLKPFRIMAYDAGSDKPFWIEGVVLEDTGFQGDSLEVTGFRLVRNYRQPTQQFPLTFYQRNNSLVYCYEHVSHIATTGTDNNDKDEMRVFLHAQNDLPEQSTEIHVEERPEGYVVLSTNGTAPDRTVACWAEIWKHKAYDQLSLVADVPKNCHSIRAMKKEYI